MSRRRRGWRGHRADPGGMCCPWALEHGSAWCLDRRCVMAWDALEAPQCLDLDATLGLVL